MMLALIIAVYAAIALLCVYLEGFLTGDSEVAALWLLWPLVLPVMLVTWLFGLVADLGKRHHS